MKLPPCAGKKIKLSSYFCTKSSNTGKEGGDTFLMIAADESNLRILNDITESVTEHISIYLYLSALNLGEYLWDLEVISLFIHFVSWTSTYSILCTGY